MKYEVFHMLGVGIEDVCVVLVQSMAECLCVVVVHVIRLLICCGQEVKGR